MFLGVEIGGTKLQIVSANADGEITRRSRGAVLPELGGPGICRQIEQAISDEFRRGTDSPIRAVGVGFGGPVDSRTGRICKSHQIEGWENFHLGDWLSHLIDGPCSIDNDANVAALGEMRCGAGADVDPVFYITLGSGVGGGLVSHGMIYHGLPPGESEFGHVRLGRQGATVESRCSGWAVDARIRAIIKDEPDCLLARLSNRNVGGEARLLAPALQQGDARAQSILQEIAEDLAFALSHVVHLAHPEAIVLGGGLSLVGEPLRQAVQDAMPAFIMRAFLPAPFVRLACLGEDAVPVGAVHLAMDSLDERIEIVNPPNIRFRAKISGDF